MPMMMSIGVIIPFLVPRRARRLLPLFRPKGTMRVQTLLLQKVRPRSKILGKPSKRLRILPGHPRLVHLHPLVPQDSHLSMIPFL